MTQLNASSLKYSTVLILSLGIVGLIPIVASAKPATSQPKTTQSVAGHHKSLGEELGLSTDQKKTMQKLNNEQMTAILKVLKNDQQQAFQQNYQKTHSFKQAFTAAKVTPAQQKQILAVRQIYHDKMVAVLNKDQQAKLTAMQKQHKETTALIPN
jgi:hypothetical protein